MIADLAIHSPEKEGGIKNRNFHVLCPIRPLNPMGLGAISPSAFVSWKKKESEFSKKASQCLTPCRQGIEENAKRCKYGGRHRPL